MQRLGPEFANTFVIKEYSTSDARIYYETEASAFRRIGPHPNIIRFYGSFTRGEENFNVLLEHADVGTLRTFFAESTPPTNEDSVKEFWKKIFQLMAALLRIHEIEPENPEDPQMFQGWVFVPVGKSSCRNCANRFTSAFIRMSNLTIFSL